MHNNYLLSEKVLVNADNEFSVNGFDFLIPSTNDKYRVIKKYDEEYDYENESQMDYVLVTLNNNFEFNFYDEDGEEIEEIKLKNN